MGASWIHGISGNPLTALAASLDLRRVATDYEQRTDFDAAGVELTGAADERPWELLDAVRAAVEAALDDAGPDRALQDVVDEVIAAQGLGDAGRRRPLRAEQRG
ncbi:MAG: hypothetical protein U1F43_10300 [Myxococcota bacterium]